MLNQFSYALLFFIFFFACKQKQEILSPEGVVQQWQSYVDHNQFERARALSTGQARAYIDFLEKITTKETADTSLTDMLQLKCEIQGDIAVCRYLIEDETGEKMPGEIKLRRIQGLWLLDRLEDFIVPAVDTLRPDEKERMFPNDSLDEEFQ